VTGLFNLTVEDLQASWIIKGHVINDTWIVEDFYAAPSIKKMEVYYDLFNNKELSKYTNSNI
jgi:hypothetical protein